MSTSRQEKLQLALANARTVLGKGATGGRPALSKLNRLRGVESVSDTRDGNLISRTRVKTRPVFDMVADDILGETAPWSPSIDLEEGESSLAQIAAKRINEMREKQVTEEISDDLLGDSVGVLKDGRPIWAEVYYECPSDIWDCRINCHDWVHYRPIKKSHEDILYNLKKD